MSTVVMHNVVSVDGYIADENDEVGPLFDWYFNGDHPLVAGEMDEPAPGGMRVSKASYDYIRPTWDAIGSMVIGQHLFDMTNGWEVGRRRGARGRGVAPAQAGQVAPWGVLPLPQRCRAGRREGEGLAGERTVAVAAGEVGGQALALGLVDEVAMDVVPVVFGSRQAVLRAGGRPAPSGGRRWSSGATGCCTCATGCAADGRQPPRLLRRCLYPA